MSENSNSFQGLFDSHLKRSYKLRTESIKDRIRKIKSIEKWTIEHRNEIREAVFKDLGKPESPADISEVFIVTAEARKAYRNLKKWNRPIKVDAPITQLGTRAVIRYEPRGTTLHIAPWNFPYNLTVIPLISSIAAGNTAIIKPSELSVHTSALIKEMTEELFDEDFVKVIEGGRETAEELLKLPFDHIFFTGSSAVGKIIMRAASANLSSVTLELGGKNPVIIAPDADLKDAAKKLTWGNFLNCGQSCVAVDYIMVPKNIESQLLEKMSHWIEKWYTGEELKNNFGRIINEGHWDRLKKILDESEKEGLTLTYFGEPNRDTLFMPPILVQGVKRESYVMKEEIFGPILPVINYESIGDVIDFTRTLPKPLAEYVFTTSSKYRKIFQKETTSGALVINDLVLQFAHKNLPFGGVNNSGSGKSHGFYGFREFSNEKPVIRQLRGFTITQLFYPPYTGFRKWVINLVVKYLG